MNGELSEIGGSQPLSRQTKFDKTRTVQKYLQNQSNLENYQATQFSVATHKLEYSVLNSLPSIAWTSLSNHCITDFHMPEDLRSNGSTVMFSIGFTKPSTLTKTSSIRFGSPVTALSSGPKIL